MVDNKDYYIGEVIDKEQFNSALEWCSTHNAILVYDDKQELIIVASLEPTDERASRLDAQLKRMLEATDKYMLEDFPVDAETKEAYKRYRKYLRDLNNQEEYPNVVILSFEDWKSMVDSTASL